VKHLRIPTQADFAAVIPPPLTRSDEDIAHLIAAHGWPAMTWDDAVRLLVDHGVRARETSVNSDAWMERAEELWAEGECLCRHREAL
jgi:hypothetical protein